MTAVDRIPVARSLWWRKFRQQVLPIIVFVGCLGCTAWLWQRHGAVPGAIGAVEAVRIDLAAGTDGVLAPLPSGKQWTLFDKVYANEVVARLDDRLLYATLATMHRELKRLNDELVAAAEQADLDERDRRLEHRREQTRLVLEMEMRRLDILDRQALIETDRIELQRLQTRLEYLEPLAEHMVVSLMELDEARLLRDATARRIEENQIALAEAERQYDIAVRRVRAGTGQVGADFERLLAPVRSAIDVHEARIAEMQVAVDALEVRAPINGTITAIHLWPGQTIRAGDPILTVAADHGRYIVSYVRQEQRTRPSVGSQVTVRTRDDRPRWYKAEVERVGPQFELVPPEQLRDPTRPEWGLPVRIVIPPAGELRPGELVDVRFTRQP